MELRQLRYFVTICAEGNLTRAAAHLHVAQQSLSQTVAALEAELGVRLLDRGPFGARTTAAGRVLCDKATALLREADAATRAVRDAAGTPPGEVHGHVRLRYGLDSEHIVEQWLPRIRAAAPGITITGWTGPDRDALAAVRRGEADLALAWAITGHVADLNTATIAREDCWAAVPATHHLAACPAVDVQALAGQPLTMFPRDAAPWVWDHIAGHFHADGRLPPRITETPVSGQGAMLEQALATGGITPVSRSLTHALERPGITFRPFQPPITVPLDLVWRDGHTLPTATVIAAAIRHRASDRGAGHPLDGEKMRHDVLSDGPQNLDDGRQ